MNFRVKVNFLKKGHINDIWSFLIGMTCGLPFILTSATLKAWMTQSGVPVYIIGFMNIINFSYLLKFAWAPVFDHYHLPGWTKQKSWIIYSHLALAAALLALAQANPNENLFIFSLCATMTAFFGANTTLSLDGYWISFIDRDNAQSFAGITEIGYRLGKILTGGIALIIADFFDWQVLYQSACILLLCLTMLLTLLPEIKTKPSTGFEHSNTCYREQMQQSWQSMYNYGGIALILFLMTVKVNEALEHNLMPVFMLKELHLTLSAVGIITKIIGIMANMVGLAIAVKSIQLFNYKKTLSIAIIINFISTLLMSIIALVKINDIPLITLFCFIDNVSRGLIATTLLALFAEKIAYTYQSATFFSIFALITGISGIIFSPISGLIVYYLGWPSLFLVSALATMPSMYILIFLDDNLKVYTNKAIQIN